MNLAAAVILIISIALMVLVRPRRTEKPRWPANK